MSAWLLLAALASAQDGLSIEEALTQAVGASETVELALAAVDRARGDRWRARSAVLPQLSFTAGYTHTFKSEFDRLFEASAGPTLPFGQNNTWRAGFTANQPIFGGGRAGAGLRIATAGTVSAEAGLASAQAAAALSVAQAYFDAALADRLLEIARETARQAAATLEETRLGNEVGRKPDFELLRAQVEANNATVAVIRAERTAQIAHLRLAQLLDVPTEATARLDSPVDEAADEPPSLAPVAAQAAGVEGAPPEERLAVLQARQAALVSQRYVAVTRAGFLPSLSATGSYGWVQYPEDGIPSFEDRAWFPSISAGVNLSVPLFNGGRVYGELLGAQATAREAEIRATQAEELAELEARDAEAELVSVEAGWDATRGTVEQAERAYAIAELRFQEGVSTQTELADTRLLLQQALANRAVAARDLQVARIRTALLPYLPLAPR